MIETRDFMMLLRSRMAIVTISSHEELRAIDLVRACGNKLSKDVKVWSVTKGLVDASTRKPDLALIDKHLDQTSGHQPLTLLKDIETASAPTLFVLADFHPYLDEPLIIRSLKEIALAHSLNGHTIILLGTDLQLPESLNKFSANFELHLPDKQKIRHLVAEEAKLWQLKNKNKKLVIDKQAVELLVKNLSGVTETDARRLIHNAIVKDDAIIHTDIPDVQQAKHELLGQDGLLSFEYDTTDFKDIGGLNRLKSWLEVRQSVFQDNSSAVNLDKPKGILLAGVQGSGKSLAAKAVAGVYGVPLMRLDFGSLYNKFFGESEKNIRHALKLAELMSPCVLWVDEIEKGIATGDYDSGTSQRILGTLLTWMSENDKAIFIVATANKIDQLPPELIRKGRLDEIFFVDLPNEDARADIFDIHLSKREVDITGIDIQALAALSDGFSGAEIEQSIVSSLYMAHTEKQPVTTQMIIDEIKLTKPLSIVMGESITKLRAWAMERTVMAN